KLSLKETSVYDCIFWKNGCTVYAARPFMCRSYPFWDSMLVSKEAWDSGSCPGCNAGTLYDKAAIENWRRLEMERD
ncbi:MAG: YkgJ family cysteine cluster protein, partial [Spirochaetaceae bacterium]|nr:YkgJ family cysteine cluster protein [Spirochaetaceae bacterium]